MRLIERLHAYANFKIETPRHSPAAHYLTFPVVEAGAMLHRTEVHGRLPKEGPAIVVANHAGPLDPPIIHWAAVTTAERTISFWAKRTLIDPKAAESKVARARRTQEDQLGGHQLNLRRLIREHAIPGYIAKFGPIPVDIGGTNIKAQREALRAAEEEIKEGRLFGSFVQGTRLPELDLLELLPGTAVLIARNPDVPVVAVGLTGTNKGISEKITINIDTNPFTARDIPGSDGKGKIEAISRFVADKIAAQIVDLDLIPAWWLNRTHGWTPEQIKQSKEEYPDLATTAGLIRELEHFDRDLGKFTFKEWESELSEIDKNAAF